MKTWKVGELAARTGLSVRALHHYDEIGLLSPSRRTRSGHRLYVDADVRRLQQIVSLRQLGLSLDEIRQWLRRGHSSPLQILELQLARLREQIEAQRALYGKLERIAAHLRRREPVTTEDFLFTIEATIMFEKYYTPEQLEQLKQRADQVGEARMREVQEEWPRLIAEVRAEMEKGTDPSDPKVQQLAERWKALILEFTGGDPGITASLTRLYQNEPSMRERTGVDSALSEYISAAGRS